MVIVRMVNPAYEKSRTPPKSTLEPKNKLAPNVAAHRLGNKQRNPKQNTANKADKQKRQTNCRKMLTSDTLDCYFQTKLWRNRTVLILFAAISTCLGFVFMFTVLGESPRIFVHP